MLAIDMIFESTSERKIRLTILTFVSHIFLTNVAHLHAKLWPHWKEGYKRFLKSLGHPEISATNEILLSPIRDLSIRSDGLEYL